MGILGQLRKALAIDKESQRKRIVKNCVDLIFNSYIGNEKINHIQVSLVLNDVKKQVEEKLIQQHKTKENELETLLHSIQNVQFNDTNK